MTAINAARAAVPRDAEGDPENCAKLTGLRIQNSENLTRHERTAALEEWTSRALDAGIRLRRASMAFNRGLVCHDPSAIEGAFEAIDDAKADIDELIDEALNDSAEPPPDVVAAAAAEYRAKRGRGNVARVAPPTPRVEPRRTAPASGETSEATRLQRERLPRAHPNVFDDGARCGFCGKADGEREPGGYPIGFHTWPAERRDVWFSGFNAGRVDRTRAANGGAA